MNPQSTQPPQIEGTAGSMPPNKKSGIGKKIVITLLVLLVMAGLGLAGWKWYGQIQEYKMNVSSLQQQIDDLESKQAESSEYGSFESKELGITFEYPISWGEATVAVGKTVSPAKGDYKQVTFSNLSGVSINFVLGAYFSPLDGCPSPKQIALDETSRLDASVIGWKKSTINMLWYEYGAVDAKKEVIMKANSAKGSDWGGWENVGYSGDVLTYRALDKTPYKAVKEGSESCYSLTKAQADEANTYYDYTRFVLNYKNDAVRGVNANINSSSIATTELQKQVVETLSSIKSL